MVNNNQSWDPGGLRAQSATANTANRPKEPSVNSVRVSIKARHSTAHFKGPPEQHSRHSTAVDIQNIINTSQNSPFSEDIIQHQWLHQWLGIGLSPLGFRSVSRTTRRLLELTNNDSWNGSVEQLWKPWLRGAFWNRDMTPCSQFTHAVKGIWTGGWSQIWRAPQCTYVCMYIYI